MTRDDEEEDTMLLEGLLSGRLREDDPRVVRAFAERPMLREELALARGIESQLPKAGALGRSELQSILAEDASATEIQLATNTALEAGSTDKFAPTLTTWRRRSASFWIATGLFAAAVAVALTLVFTKNGEKATNPGDEILAPDGALDLRPTGTEDFQTFSWTSAVPVGGHFEVFVFDTADGPLFDQPVVQSGPLARGTWDPTQEQQIAMPDEIYWELHEVVEGRSRLRGSTRARR